MTKEEMIEELRVRIVSDYITEEEVPNSLLLSYLEEAQSIIYTKVYPFNRGYGDIPEKYHRKQVEIAMYLFSKNGAEGETMHTEGQTTRMYQSGGVPDSMLSGITPYVGMYTDYFYKSSSESEDSTNENDG